MKDVNAYFQSRVDEFAAQEDLADLWRQARDLHAKKLWHQLTGVLDRLAERPEVRSRPHGNPASLSGLYESAVAEFETKLQPLRLARLAEPVAASLPNLEESTAFLERVGGKVKANPEAAALVRVTVANECLRRDQQGQTARIKTILEEVEALLDEVDSVGKVHKEYYKLSSEYYKLQGDHSKYYQVS